MKFKCRRTVFTRVLFLCSFQISTITHIHLYILHRLRFIIGNAHTRPKPPTPVPTATLRGQRGGRGRHRSCVRKKLTVHQFVWVDRLRPTSYSFHPVHAGQRRGIALFHRGRCVRIRWRWWRRSRTTPGRRRGQPTTAPTSNGCVFVFHPGRRWHHTSKWIATGRQSQPAGRVTGTKQ
jgi:hypothetical protein